MVAGTLLYTPHKIHTLVRVLCRLVLKEVLALMGSQESSSLHEDQGAPEGAVPTFNILIRR